jgi:hypothetical protein
MTAAMSARDLRDWLADARPALAAAGVDAVYAGAPRLNADGATWISFSSRWGSGRLVREVDGSSASTTLRYGVGKPVLTSTSPTTTASELAAVVDALRAP